MAAREDLEKAIGYPGDGGIQSRGGGIAIGGGTPGHRTLEITYNGAPIGLKMMAASEKEINQQLDALASSVPHMSRDKFDVIRPEEWPVQHFFTEWFQSQHG